MRGGDSINRLIGMAVFIIIVCISVNDLTAGNLTEDPDSLLIVTPIEAKRDILPDRYVFSTDITVVSQRESDALNILGEIDDGIRNLGVRYRGGKYSVSKKCWWEHDKRICNGYKGRVHYIFEMFEPASQDTVLELFSKYKENSRLNIDINISNTGWIVSEDKKRSVTKELRYEAIRNSLDLAEQIAGMLNRLCIVKEINFQPPPSTVYPPYRAMMKERSIKAPEPTKDEYSITIRAETKIICR